MKVTKAENLTSNTLSQIPTLIKRMNKQLFASGASIKPQKRHQIGVPNTPQKLNQITKLFISGSTNRPQEPQQPHWATPLQQGLVQSAIIWFTNHFTRSIKNVTNCKVLTSSKSHKVLCFSFFSPIFALLVAFQVIMVMLFG